VGLRNWRTWKSSSAGSSARRLNCSRSCSFASSIGEETKHLLLQPLLNNGPCNEGWWKSCSPA